MPQKETALAVRDEEALARVNEKLSLVPAVDEDPTARMLEAIYAAGSPEDWASLWDKLPNVKDNEGRPLRVHDIRLRESDYEGSDYYLICDVTWLDSGERQLLSCSSTTMCLQLAKAHVEGWFPLDLRIDGPRKPSKAGYRPLHFHALQPEELKAKAGVA